MIRPSSTYVKYNYIFRTTILICLIFTSCTKDNSSDDTSNSNINLIGNWTLVKDVIKTTYSNGSSQTDSTIFYPKGITAEFKSDSSIAVKEWVGGSIYATDIQSFKIKGDFLYWTKYWSPTIIDTFKMEVFNSKKLTLYKKTISSTETIELRDYWERY